MREIKKQNLIAKNTVLNLLGQILPLLVAVITVPAIIKNLGEERFGILSFSWLIIGYFNIFDLGLGKATTKFIATFIGKKQFQKIHNIFWTAIIAQLILGIIGLFVFYMIVPILVNHILNISIDLITEAEYTFQVLSFALPLVLITGSIRGILEAAQRFDLVNSVKIPYGVSNFAIPYLGSIWGWNLPQIILTMIIFRGISLLIYFALDLRIFPQLAQKAAFNYNELKKLFNFGGWVTVSSIIAPILIYFDRLAIGILLTMTAVTYYVAPYEMITKLWIIPTSLVITIFPAISKLESDKKSILITKNIILHSIKFVVIAISPIVILTILFGENILSIWLGKDFAEKSSIVLKVLSVGVLSNSIGYVFYTYLQAAGRPDIPAKLHILEVPLHILIVWLSVGFWGINGAAFAWSVRVTLDTFLLFLFTLKIANIPIKSFSGERIPQLMGVLLVLTFFIVFAKKHIASMFWQIGFSLMILLIIGFLFWVYFLNEKEKTIIFKLLKL